MLLIVQRKAGEMIVKKMMVHLKSYTAPPKHGAGEADALSRSTCDQAGALECLCNNHLRWAGWQLI